MCYSEKALKKIYIYFFSKTFATQIYEKSYYLHKYTGKPDISIFTKLKDVYHSWDFEWRRLKNFFFDKWAELALLEIVKWTKIPY